MPAEVDQHVDRTDRCGQLIERCARRREVRDVNGTHSHPRGWHGAGDMLLCSLEPMRISGDQSYCKATTCQLHSQLEAEA